MYTARTFGRLVLPAAIMLLAGCSSAPAAEQDASATAQPGSGVISTPAVSPSPEPSAIAASPVPSANAAPSATAAPETAQPGRATEPAAPEEGMPPTALEAAATVMRALKSGNMNTLADWVSRDKGVRFSPYGYVDTEHDLVFTQEEITSAMKDTKKHTWGTYAGSGEPIRLTFAEYYNKFVYDANYMEKADTSLNEVIGKGTTLNNIHEVYPAGSYDWVEYHNAGTDPAAEGMDWSSLRLVFENIGGDHILVGIVHDEWTP